MTQYIHPVTGMLIEDGRGCLPEKEQLTLHCHAIEQRDGEDAADAARRKLNLPVPREIAATAAQAEVDRIEREKIAVAAMADIKALIARVEALEKIVAAKT